MKAVDTLGLIRNKSIFNTQYKSVNYAIAEVIDNAIDKNATRVLIIPIYKLNSEHDYVLQDIIFLNNGEPIQKEDLTKALSIGNTTNSENSDAIGRFGVGFKYALFSFAKRIDIYSLNDVDGSYGGYKSFFDPEKMLELSDDTLPEPFSFDLYDEIGCAYPAYYSIIKDYIDQELVAQDRCSSITMVRASSITKVLEQSNFEESLTYELGRIYRYYLSTPDCEIPFTKIKFGFVLQYYNFGSKSIASILSVDPLFLMKNDTVLLDSINVYDKGVKITDDTTYGIPLFESFDYDVVDDFYFKKNITTNSQFEYIYSFTDKLNKKTHYFYIRMSHLRKEILWGINSPGKGSIGDHAAQRTGISFIRNGREISYDKTIFDTYSSERKAKTRFLGFEIHFTTESDYIMGISTNKQSVAFSNSIVKSSLENFYKKIVNYYLSSINDALLKLPSSQRINSNMSFFELQKRFNSALKKSKIKRRVIFVSSTKEIEYDANLPLIDCPKVEKEGHSFIAWFFDPEYLQLATLEAVQELISNTQNDIKLYAKWDRNQYTIEFITDDNELPNVNVYFDEIIPALPTYHKEGFEFIGWETIEKRLFTSKLMPARNIELIPRLKLISEIPPDEYFGLSIEDFKKNVSIMNKSRLESRTLFATTLINKVSESKSKLIVLYQSTKENYQILTINRDFTIEGSISVTRGELLKILKNISPD